MKKSFLINAVLLLILSLSAGSSLYAQNEHGNTLTLTTENFDKTIKSGVVLVDFWATWCRPCLMQGPIIDELADSLKGKVVVGKVDTDKNRELMNRFAVQYIPTTIIFVDGVAVDRASGLQTKEVLMERLTPYLK